MWRTKDILFAFCCLFFYVKVDSRPQTSQQLAKATKQTELNYYNSDAPDLIPFDNPQNIDNGRQEYEGYGSKIDSVYDGLHKKTSNFFNPKPVVDGIKETEKYGNDGTHLKGVQNIVLSVMSVVSNVVNSVIEAPGQVIATVTNRANTVLNQIGGKIVGLQRK